MIRFKNFLIFLLILLISCSLFAAYKPGIVTKDMLAKFRQAVKDDGSIKAKRNALTSVHISKVVRNYDILNGFDFNFTKRLKMYGVTNQKRTGRCWLFAALNILRRDVAKELNLGNFELSHTYNYFYDKIEKANLFLEYMIQNQNKDILDRTIQQLLRDPIMDGGQWNMVVELINKYGVVPKSAMGETVNSENSRYMLRLINRKLRKDVAILRKMAKEGKNLVALRAEKKKMLEDIYKLLVMHLGEPPAKFVFRYETKDKKLSDPEEHTPFSFTRKYVKVDLNNYVMFYNDPRNEFNRLYRIRLDRDMVDKDDLTYANINMRDMKGITFKSIMAESPVWFGADVGKQSERDKGVMAEGLYQYCKFFGTCFHMDKKDRILYREETPTHAMVFAGVDVHKGKPVKWLVENSWGSKNGKNGYYVMYDNWFDEYVLAVVVERKFVPKKILDVFKTKPILLEPWDPMYDILKIKF